MCLKKNIFLLFLAAGTGALLSGCGLFDSIEARQIARDGNSLYRASDYRGAIKKYKEAVALDPETPNVHLNLGYSYFSIYDPTSQSEQDKNAATLAVAAFDEHFKRQPDDEDARVFQIKILLSAAPNDQELADEAHALFLEMLKKNPNDHEARQYLITLFIDGKRYEDAVAFFAKELTKKPDDIVTMKILAIIADKSNQQQDAIDWYFRRVDAVPEAENKAVLLYEVGTYAWNLLHYHPEKAGGVLAIKLADQGIGACLRAMKLKKNYAEAMVYANLLYLKRALYETEEIARTWDNALAYEMRIKAGKILKARKIKAGSKKKDGAKKGS